jgi:hypothetical protein
METNNITKVGWDKEEVDENQQKVDVQRIRMVSTLTLEDQLKFALVERILGELATAGIPAYIYAGLPRPGVEDSWRCIYQYNTLPALVKYAEDGTLDEECANKVSEFNAALWHSLFTTITVQSTRARQFGLDKLHWSDRDSFKQVLDFFVGSIINALQVHSKNVSTDPY